MENKSQITKGIAQDFPAIQRIVETTWPITYGPILTDKQIQYMLDLIYSGEALSQQLDQGHNFYLLKENDGSVIGFIDLEKTAESISKLHKIYLLPDQQGKGYGKKLLDYAIRVAREQGSRRLQLNVNRYNKALAFYQKMGLQIIKEVDIPIGNGYFMNDFVLELNLID